MSMNLSLVGKRDIYIPSIDKHEVQYKTIHLYQTPTTITYQAMDSGDTMQSYLEYVASVVNEPNELKEHIQELNHEIAELKEQGYKIEFEVV